MPRFMVMWAMHIDAADQVEAATIAEDKIVEGLANVFEVTHPETKQQVLVSGGKIVTLEELKHAANRPQPTLNGDTTARSTTRTEDDSLQETDT